MTEQAKRDNSGKPLLAEVLHFRKGLEFLADHIQAGREKYPDTSEGVPNWKLGGKPDAEYLNAAARHLAALVDGEEYDVELGTHHAAAVTWNMLALLTCNRDHRPPIAPGFGLQKVVWEERTDEKGTL